MPPEPQLKNLSAEELQKLSSELSGSRKKCAKVAWGTVVASLQRFRSLHGFL